MLRTTTYWFLLCLPLAAQAVPAGFAGAGYRTPPNAVEAAPGQVIIISVNGAQTRVADPIFGIFDPFAGMSPIVAGFSAQLVQSTGRTPAGIYGVSQSSCATTTVPCVPVTNITLIVPFALLDTQKVNGVAVLEVKEGNNVLANVPVRAVSDKVHVITSCDDTLIYYSVFGEQDISSCTAAVVRPRGGLILPSRPVHQGEPLVAFSYGMGETTPSPASGAAFIPGLTKQPFVLRYAVAGGPVYWAQAPDGVSLATFNGTYEVHFTVPPLPDNTPLPACGEKGVYGNMTVTLSGIHSTDKFELCVTP
ncbi:MAG: hypothetical protein ABI972_31735 [Acidobacteriota bacterium]